MSNNETTLELLRKLGEIKADSYEINWDEWQLFESEANNIEKLIDSGIAEYEELFLEYSEKINNEEYDILDEDSEIDYDSEEFRRFEEIIDQLVKGYIYRSMCKKKKAIEDFISSI